MATETEIQKKTLDEVTRREHTRSDVQFSPNVDILENEDELMVVADMPGVAPDDVDINFEKGTLSIYGKAMPRQRDGVTYMLNEFGVGDFWRTFEVSETIDSEQISAEMETGVLTLHLPKIAAVRPRKIAVRAT